MSLSNPPDHVTPLLKTLPACPPQNETQVFTKPCAISLCTTTHTHTPPRDALTLSLGCCSLFTPFGPQAKDLFCPLRAFALAVPSPWSTVPCTRPHITPQSCRTISVVMPPQTSSLTHTLPIPSPCVIFLLSTSHNVSFLFCCLCLSARRQDFVFFVRC